jgi:hypothetical protein
MSGSNRGVSEICGLLVFEAGKNGSYLPTFGESLSVLSGRVKQPKSNMEQIGCPETSVGKKLSFLPASNPPPQKKNADLSRTLTM